ncbi:2,3-bisphosphoglycerate-independent phosphoglycerate mutase [Desulfobacter hydrogenophilus]|uniref:2,3-bisphosphoglycerate-independent phosphoglycerate mutase n=1 Tax=Desulfobacter hydrogenophilus TaxID=2291 RepID=A0A328FBX5_9BACT|nr:2,3-bisphosphoglycerate-independent phosphoglycerate mutase [Desulfobacter hydrogenophilus]NDY72176.1 2,3-bisphosphoglycerate-independent phosphoglycerate mutase [Desulfobacter hydrogenophilus]QBH15142.1 2,3-bisphosphoglycerate-independent phosphoglycerate mutase [Desulfobacter hydrogenophilus]RAM02184.1 2,3-bisphosphoglycerate-independent phosphoglycerate mutase [Desulfobacter hydrogenophilus]
MGSEQQPVNILMILDGWGISLSETGNAVAAANTPFLDTLLVDFPSTTLKCCGEAVGLPDGTMGNSEVGHMNIGAGRIVAQDFVRINTAIRDNNFSSTPALVSIMDKVKQAGKSLHLLGLLSDGGVHSHINHLFALIKMAKDKGITKLYIHPIMDGRDTSPTSGIDFLKQLDEKIHDLGTGKVATMTGRFWAMDRDTRWERVQKAFELYTQGKGVDASDQTPAQAIQAAYDRKETDEFIKPVYFCPGNEGNVEEGDGVIFFNFRADRAKEITRAFTEKNFNGFQRTANPAPINFVCMTQYDEHFDLPVAFGPQHLDKIFGQILSENEIPQLRIAETEKYAHVTYFFNGGDEAIFDGEERILIPSPRDVDTYDQKPEMSADKVADKACEQISSGKFQFVVLNFANMDMVGHTGIFDAAVKACETVDRCVKKVVEAIWETGGTAFITADHGNSEQMLAQDGSPYTAHTLNPVRFIVAAKRAPTITLMDGKLGDIAPTILQVLGIEQPLEMTGQCLIQGK